MRRVFAYRAERTSAPGSEPLTTAEVKEHSRIDTSAEDSLIDALVSAAREHVEHFTGRALISQTWKSYLDAFPARDDAIILLPRPPLQSVDSITYLDLDGNSQTWAASKYQVDAVGEPARVLPVEAEDYPDTQDETINAVTIEFTAGYGGGASDVPQPIRQAMLLLVAHWYEHRESVGVTNMTPVPMTVDSLLWPYRVIEI